VTNDGSNWVDVETVGPTGSDTSGGWNYHEFNLSSLVAPSSQVQVRFIASDEGSGSIVEAAVDDFQVFELDCEFCQTDLGGPGTAQLSLCGEPLLPGNTAELLLSNAPATRRRRSSTEPASIRYRSWVAPGSPFRCSGRSRSEPTAQESGA
jgi:hypothetical protein